MTKKRYAILMNGCMEDYEMDDIVNALRSCNCKLDLETKKYYRGGVTITTILSFEESKANEIELMLNRLNISYRCLDEYTNKNMDALAAQHMSSEGATQPGKMHLPERD